MEYKAKQLYRENDVAQGYDEQRFRSLKGRLADNLEKRGILRSLKKAGILPPARILDLPSGSGRIALLLGREGYLVNGVDVSPAMVDLAAEKCRGQLAPGQVIFRQGEGEALDFAAGTFDLTLSLRLFGHLPTAPRLKILRELIRVSKRFVLVAYYRQGTLQERLRRRFRKKQGIFWNPVSSNTIKTEIIAAGLQVRACFTLVPLVSETLLVLAEKQE